MPFAYITAGVLATAILVTAAPGLQGTRPLPDPDTLYEAVRENLLRTERLTQLYAYRERRTDVHRNPFGRLGTGGISEFAVYPSTTQGLTYRRLVARDGVPLSDDELAGQDRDYVRRVMEERRQRAAWTAQERQRADDDAERASQRRRRRVEDVVGTLRFNLEGRGVYRGAPALVVSFAPKAGARPETREGRLAASFKGTIWIDEAASEVMHVQGTSIRDINFGFGLVARVGEGAEAFMTREPLVDGVWMPSRLGLSGRGRAAIFRNFVLDYSVEWFGYTRLSGRSDAPFLDREAPEFSRP